jgi:hypothetical protein
MIKMQKSLLQFAQEMTAQLELMEGREKGNADQLLNIHTTIIDYDFLTGDDGDYVVFIVKEDKDHFYFGGGVVTDHMQKFDAAGYKEEIQQNGLPVTFEKKKSKKSGRTYTNAVFFPNN